MGRVLRTRDNEAGSLNVGAEKAAIHHRQVIAVSAARTEDQHLATITAFNIASDVAGAASCAMSR